jgi:hypothetical protein
MGLLDFSIEELNRAGMTEDSPEEMNRMMRKHILHMVNEFAEEGHSGMSASYALNILKRLLAYQPLSPLTGEDDEWVAVGDDGDIGGTLYQNKRCSRIFKNNTSAWNIEGKVFWEWQRRPLEADEAGYPGFRTYKTMYTCRDSRTEVTFPYSVPEHPIYEYRYSDAEPPAPKQTEEGIIE